MRITPTPLPGVFLLEPAVHRDDRGSFTELFRVDHLAAEAGRHPGLPSAFAQWNRSRSAPGVLRGLHYQLARPQGKLISVVRGAIYDVAVDVRRDSPTFGGWTGATLDADSARQLWVPPGFAHGFCVLGDEPADVVYGCTALYDQASESGVRWDDPSLGISWPVPSPRVSARDARLPLLDPARPDLPACAGGDAPALVAR